MNYFQEISVKGFFSSFLKSFGIMLLSTSCFAQHRWPVEFFLTHPYIYTVGPERPYSFVNHGGFQEFSLAPDERRLFNYLPFSDEWSQPKRCIDSAREHGFVHSTPVSNDESLRLGIGSIKVVVPIQLRIRAEANKVKNKTILNWPILKLSVIHLNEQKQFDNLLSQSVSVQSLVSEDLAANLNGLEMNEEPPVQPLDVNFNGIFVSEPIRNIGARNFRFRLEWAADGICDETEFQFKIGDQFRVVRFDE